MTPFASGNTDTEKLTIVAGMGELHVSSSPDAILACIGLGSCIAVFVYDKVAIVGGIAHIVLPKYDGISEDHKAKYADIAVPLLISEVVKMGALKNRLIIRITGGAQMTKAPGLGDTFKIGERNRIEVLAALEREKMSLAGADVGGNMGRTARLYMNTGKIIVKTVGGIIKEL